MEGATQEVKTAGTFRVRGLCVVGTRTKPAARAGKREVFDKAARVKQESLPGLRSSPSPADETFCHSHIDKDKEL